MGNGFGFGHFVGRFGGSPNATVVHICQVTSWKSTWGTLWKQLGRWESLQGSWITLDYYYDNPKHFANVKAIKANLNQFSPCRTGMEDIQTICWFYRTPPPKQRIISKIFTLKENHRKLGIKHLSDFKIHQPEPRHLFGGGIPSLYLYYLLIAGSKLNSFILRWFLK